MTKRDVEHPLKIRDYALIGDCRSAALIGRNGSLDWLCWPKFDSPAIFAGLLDSEQGGHWGIAPVSPYRSSRRYVGQTNVLETTFETGDSRAVLTDLMPVASEEYKRRVLVSDHEVLRQVECTEGELDVEVVFELRSNYGSEAVRIRPTGEIGLRIEAGRALYWLRSNLPLSVDGKRAYAGLHLKSGEIAQFSLSYAEDAPAVLPLLGDAARDRIRISLEWWQQWADRAKYDGPYRDAIVRSALTLKMLTYSPSGALVAAPTTSLPEKIGASLNWDYRYCWLRDASLTVRAMLSLGYWDEAEAFMDWIVLATSMTQPELRILYTVFGDNAPRERELTHLKGFWDSRPVRIGNQARGQLQLDVYGEVVDAAAQFAFHGRGFDRTTQKVLIEWGKYVVGNWNQPDEGIWEPRVGRQHHTHSRLLCWTALDRLCKLANSGVLAGAPVELFAKHRDTIAKDIQQNSWNQWLNSYVSEINGRDLDASLLLLAWYGFEDAASERMVSTYRAINRNLQAGPALLYRNKSELGEGAFGICSFWEAEYLALGGGSLERARSSFEQLLSYANEVGLFAEEIDPGSGDALGNFPQAFTHVGLINAALSLRDREQGRLPLAHREKPPKDQKA